MFAGRWACASAMLLAACTAMSGAVAQTSNGLPPTLAALAEAYGGFSAQDLDAVAHGGVAVTAMHASDKDEVALMALVLVDVPRSFYVTHAWDVLTTLENVSSSGMVHAPATPADFDGFSLTENEAKSLKRCRPLHCDLKLSINQISQVAHEIRWAPDATAQADSLLREWLAELANDYRARGDAALPVYDDTRIAEESAAGFAILLSENEALLRNAPALAEHLRQSPSLPMAGIESAIYWTVDRPEGLTPIVSMVQRSTFSPADTSAATLMISKQLYASHYFDARLDMTALAEQGMRSYALVTRRFRFDKLPSSGMFDLRGRIIRKLRNALRDELVAAKARLEAGYGHPDGR
jgi:hypothetical protein